MVNDFLLALDIQSPFHLGELSVTFAGATAVIAAPGADAGKEVAASPEAIRLQVRFDDRGRYRPLSGARTLPRGWHALCTGPDAVEQLLETVYPLAIAHARQFAAGQLRVVGLDDVLTRQSGRYSGVSALSEAGRELARDELCSRCVRTPVWRGDDHSGAVPCPEPCSVLVALCREAVFWEQEPPAPAPIDHTVPFADFEAPGNEVREGYLARAVHHAAGT